MRKILLVVTLFSSLSVPAWSALPEASAYEKKLSSADDWSEIAAHLKGKLPSNVVKEFAKYAEDIEFPASRRIKNKLVLTESDGTKVTVVFKKDGAISLNGKDWKLRPLATVEEEVSRLALFLSGEKKVEAGLFGLVPAANAGGAGGFGAAAAAFAGANAWKAEACGEEELVEDLVNDCPLMAVKMQPILVKARKIEDPDLFLPVALKCPKAEGGTLELVSKNVLGQAERLKVEYKKDKPVKVVVEAAEKNSSFEEIYPTGMELDESERKNIVTNVFMTVDPIWSKVCFGGKKERKRYLESLASNASDLKDYASVQDPSSEKSSMDAL